MKGNVFDIQRYSIHDGKGIRTVIFLKGCPLRCKWCANPESWGEKPELFYIKSRCIHCKTCVKVCKNGEVQEKNGEIIVDHRKCTEDLQWTQACPTGAMCVKGHCMTGDEVLKEIRKDKVFYQYSDGGVTFSGGEPLLQVDFLTEVLKTCKEEGMNTTVETSGAVPWESFEKVMPYVDLFLFDVKTMDEEIHKQYIGTSNRRILENLKNLAQAGCNIMVRTPMIPGVNNRQEDIRKIMKYLKNCKICKYNVLPFHQYGSGKYESIGREYSMKEVIPEQEERIKKIYDLIEQEGFEREF